MTVPFVYLLCLGEKIGNVYVYESEKETGSDETGKFVRTSYLLRKGVLITVN